MKQTTLKKKKKAITSIVKHLWKQMVRCYKILKDSHKKFSKQVSARSQALKELSGSIKKFNLPFY